MRLVRIRKRAGRIRGSDWLWGFRLTLARDGAKLPGNHERSPVRDQSPSALATFAHETKTRRLPTRAGDQKDPSSRLHAPS